MSKNIQYEAVIGMEVHIESHTESKMFCACPNGFGLEKTPNTHICPICIGHPGTLPVPNRRALVNLAKLGLGLQCKLEKYTWFERKSYFYPDLPKGYQITQYERPLCFEGKIEVPLSDGTFHPIRITRIHMEEDTGKLTHDKMSGNSLVDYNRAGVPLMELVTEPDIRTSEQAKAFCEQLQSIARYLEVSDADMEKGQMRCEVNISMRPKGQEKFGTKVEIKNLNSFRAVYRSIEYEIERQTELLESGSEEIVQETRGWNDELGKTVSQRTKENAHQYRYFVEPDVPPFHTDLIVVEAKKEMLELPLAKRKRFLGEYPTLTTKSVDVLVKDKYLAEYFENIISELKSWYVSHNTDLPRSETIESREDYQKLEKLATNYLLTEVLRLESKELGFGSPRISAENFAEFVTMIGQGVVSSSGAQTLLYEMFETQGDPSEILESKGLTQISDEGELEKSVGEVLVENPEIVDKYKNGEEKLLQFLIGQTMKKTKGKANPQVVAELIKKKTS
jgi:aspartyl-tRNA(Asn)/glutamyl-tRNA(Gln) amidotransferase subunit B